jgi:hypothetical protein
MTETVICGLNVDFNFALHQEGEENLSQLVVGSAASITACSVLSAVAGASNSTASGGPCSPFAHSLGEADVSQRCSQCNECDKRGEL